MSQNVRSLHFFVHTELVKKKRVKLPVDLLVFTVYPDTEADRFFDLLFSSASSSVGRLESWIFFSRLLLGPSSILCSAADFDWCSASNLLGIIIISCWASVEIVNIASMSAYAAVVIIIMCHCGSVEEAPLLSRSDALCVYLHSEVMIPVSCWAPKRWCYRKSHSACVCVSVCGLAVHLCSRVAVSLLSWQVVFFTNPFCYCTHSFL